MTPLHLVFLFGAIPAIAYSDILGSRWIRGGAPIAAPRLQLLHRWIYLCLTGIIATGLIMVLPRIDRFLTNPVFIVKMVFVGALIINSFVIGIHMRLASYKYFTEVSRREKVLLYVSGAVSLCAWIGAIAGGLMIG